jgi:hypothetical protein
VFGSEILDVAIGLILIFLLLSLVCSSVKEAIETVFKYRARDLEHGIREMFGDIGRKDLIPKFYRNPLINGLFKGHYNPNNIRNLPSYIPSRTFALAVIDLVKSEAPKVLSGPPAEPGAQGESIASRAAASATTELKAAVSYLPENSNLRGALLPLIQSAGDNMGQAIQNIEDWYNSAMDRVSGWYKRRTQIIIAIFGFAIAAGMNIDAIGITRYLNTSQTARAVVIAQAEARRQGIPPSPSDLVDPLAWLEQQGGVPLGWRTDPGPGPERADYERDWRKVPKSLEQWLIKIGGILFTGFAISLGAPFWFDLLNKFMVIRSTVKPEEKSQEEGSKA